MTRVLILGAAGMLGHALCRNWADRFECWGTVRATLMGASAELFQGTRIIPDVLVEDPESWRLAIEKASPDVVVNCIGAIKQAQPTAAEAIRVNALFPHELAECCYRTNVRCIHVSTDCVFSGARGQYAENDTPDATDLYGRTKALGELTEAGCLTLRTSLIGRELHRTRGLLEWLLAHRGQTVSGYSRAIFSGLTTAAFAEEVATLIEGYPMLCGIYHLASEPISKLDLLTRLNDRLELGITIVADNRLAVDRSLDSTCLERATGLPPRLWDIMIEGLQGDLAVYDKIRGAA